MEFSKSSGLYLFSSGAAWERAFQGALDFLAQPTGMVLLGPAVGDSAQAWLKENARVPLQFGLRTQRWEEWVQARARSAALTQWRGFRVLSQPAKREYFRYILRTLSEGGVFHHLTALWEEERFFSGLLDSVEEARLAGGDPLRQSAWLYG